MRPKRKSGFVAESIGNEVVLYSSDQRAIHVLNSTAQVIWDLCDGDHTLSDIEQEIRRRFAVPEGQDVAGDIRRTMAVFAEKQLLDQNG